jgi:hypothetical protein
VCPSLVVVKEMCLRVARLVLRLMPCSSFKRAIVFDSVGSDSVSGAAKIS